MRRNRRRKRSLLPVLIAVLLVAFIMFKFVMVVRNVSVRGVYDTPAEDIIRDSCIDFGSSILKVDEEEIRKNLEGAGQYTLNDVHTAFPNRVILDVSRRYPAAMLLNGGKIVVLDKDANVIASENEAPDMDLVYISGDHTNSYRIGSKITINQLRMEAYLAVMHALTDQGAAYLVSEVKLEEPEELVIISRTGIVVKMGDMQNMNQKIAWMKSAVLDLESRKEYSGTLDVSSGTKADFSRNVP